MCPLCGSSFNALSENGNSLICAKNNHCFDIAAKGYVNFIPNQKQESLQYSKKLFESRASVFEAGVYDAVIEQISNVISSKFYLNSAMELNNQSDMDDKQIDKKTGTSNASVKNTKYNLLDVGCGEGYYAAKLSEKPELNVFGIDIIKEAIIASCKKKVPVKWMVADLTKIPMESESVDVLLNVLTTANYDEFKRVLKKDGIIVKVIPGSDYLKEIREIVKSELHNKEYSNESVVELFKRHVELLDIRTVNYKFPVDEHLFRQIMHMTPLTSGVDLDGLELEKNFKPAHITIDLQILTGKLLG